MWFTLIIFLWVCNAYRIFCRLLLWLTPISLLSLSDKYFICLPTITWSASPIANLPHFDAFSGTSMRFTDFIYSKAFLKNRVFPGDPRNTTKFLASFGVLLQPTSLFFILFNMCAFIGNAVLAFTNKYTIHSSENIQFHGCFHSLFNRIKSLLRRIICRQRDEIFIDFFARHYFDALPMP